MRFSENLQFLREQECLTQEQLAERMEVSRQSVSKWESGVSFPEMEKLLVLCDMFDTDLDTLLRGDVRKSGMEDTARYDAHMNWFSKMVAGGVGAVLLGVTLMIALTGLGVDETIAVAVLLSIIAVSVMMLIVAGLRNDSFARKYPEVPDFYTLEQRENFERKFPFLIAVPVASILIGVVWLVLCGEQAEQAGERAEMLLCAAFLLVVTVSVTVLVWAGIQCSKYDLETWNREHDPSPEAVARRKKSDWISGIIMLSATAFYLLIGFGVMAWNNNFGSSMGWKWGWIVYPVGGILCGIVNSVVNRERSK